MSFDALPGVKVEAEIQEIGREATQATRTYPVTLVMDQPEGAEILPGMAGNASITSRPPDGTALVGIEVPMSAVFTADDPDKRYVWILEPSSNTLSRREVTLGPLSQYGVLVETGLDPGDTVVTKGVHTLSEGEEVQIYEPSQRGAAT